MAMFTAARSDSNILQRDMRSHPKKWQLLKLKPDAAPQGDSSYGLTGLLHRHFCTDQICQNARKLTLSYQYTLLDLLVCSTDTCWNAPALVTSARSLAAILGLESPSSVYPPVSVAPVSSIQRSPSHTAAKQTTHSRCWSGPCPHLL